MNKVNKRSLSLMAIVCGLIACTSVFADEGRGFHHRMHKHFDKVDANGDGLISRQEQLDFSAKRFDDNDENGDGMLSKEEIKQSFIKQRKDKAKYLKQAS